MIPINMRDGSLICIGKGNEDWNFSAPHGAGRLMSRTAAFERLTMEEYQKEMQGIYSTCINVATLDESPMAYKSMNEIIEIAHCKALKEITVPEQVEVISGDIFSKYETETHDLIITTALKEKPDGWSNYWNGGLNVIWDAENAKIFTQGDFLFCVQNGHAAILLYTGKDSSTIVPATVRFEDADYPVTVIGNYAFEYKDYLTQISLPDTLEYVGTNVFHRTENLKYTVDGYANYLGNAQNAYLVLVRFDAVSTWGDPLTIRSQIKIILAEASDSVYSISELTFEEGCSLVQIGENALHVSCGESYTILLPKGIRYIGKGAISTDAKVFVSEDARPAGWDEDWCVNCRVYWGVEKNIVETEEALFAIEGETATLVQCNAQTDEYSVPQRIDFGGKTYPVNRIGKGAMVTARCRTVFIPASIEYFEENSVKYEDIGTFCIEAAQVPETWSEFWNRGSIYCINGVTPETYAFADGVHYILHEGYAEAYRYTGKENIFALPRTIQVGNITYPVSEISATFIGSLSYIHIVFFDSVERIEAAKHYGHGVYIYTTYESDPIGWESGWNAKFSGSIPVYYGLKGVDETLREYSFVTDGTLVDAITAVMIPQEPQTEKTGMYFWGWYDNAAYEGKPIEFPYGGSATVLFARFESEQLQDGKGFDTAIKIEENTPTPVTIEKSGQSVFFMITVPKGKEKDYIFKSTGDLDTYGIIYDSNGKQIVAADSGGADENFSITHHLGSSMFEKIYYFEVKLVDKAQTGTFNVLLFPM